MLQRGIASKLVSILQRPGISAFATFRSLLPVFWCASTPCTDQDVVHITFPIAIATARDRQAPEPDHSRSNVVQFPSRKTLLIIHTMHPSNNSLTQAALFSYTDTHPHLKPSGHHSLYSSSRPADNILLQDSDQNNPSFDIP